MIANNSVPQQAAKVIVMPSDYGYLVAIDNGTEGLHIVNEQPLLRNEAIALASRTRKRLALETMMAEAQDNRMRKAIQLVASGAVHRNAAGYVVDSQSETGKRYHIHNGKCSCADKTYNNVAQCKHEIACTIASRLAA